MTLHVLSVRIRGNGHPVVILPWFGLDHRVTSAAFEPVFSGHSGWRRIYIDLPGTGKSRPVLPRSDAVLAAIEETVDAVVGSGPFLLAGCSYGGYLAAGLARRVPARVDGLFLVCSGVKISPAERNLSRVLASTPEPDWLSEVPPDLHRHFRHAIGEQTRAVANRVARAFELARRTDDDYLAELRATGYKLLDEMSANTFGGYVTLLTGRRDRVAGHLDQLNALARYPHGNYIALADAGHYLPFEQPKDFAEIMLNWLTGARLSRSGLVRA